MTNQVTVRIDYDAFAEDPFSWDRHWLMHSFSTRHGRFKHPTQVITELGGVEELEKRLAEGTAFWLDCYQHSGVAWSLAGEGMQCPWDTARRGGLLVWNRAITELLPCLGDREVDLLSWRAEQARGCLKVYNHYLNGEVYGYCVRRDGEFEDSCSGYYDVRALLCDLAESIGDSDYILEGDLAEELSEDLRAEVCHIRRPSTAFKGTT